LHLQRLLLTLLLVLPLTLATAAAGDILVKAWQLCCEEQRLYLEEDCIQVLMKAAILAKSPQLHINLLRVLRAFHREKTTPSIDAMLCGLYEPILWRHLNAANAQVRSNALSLMFEAFPIQVCCWSCLLVKVLGLHTMMLT
jgi:condensin-2 complex subunit G2